MFFLFAKKCIFSVRERNNKRRWDLNMNNGKEKNKENTKDEYKVNYFFDENSKTNINEILKKSFLLSLDSERK